MTQRAPRLMIVVFSFVTPLLLKLVNSQDPSLYYFCTSVTGKNDWLLDVFVRKNGSDMNQMFGVELSSGSSMGMACDATPAMVFPPINPSQEVTGDGTNANPFTVRITTNSLTKLPHPACGAEVSNPATLRVNFQPVSPSSEMSWEVQHALTCDYSNTTTTQTDTVLAVATITEATVTVTDLGDPLVLKVLNPRGQVVTEVTTSEVYLQAQFFSGPSIYTPMANVTGISPHSCKICNTKDCSGSLVTDITDTNGCPVGNYFLSSGFTGNGVLLKSSLISLASVSSYGYMYFVCEQDYCTLESGLNKCKDQGAADADNEKSCSTADLLRPAFSIYAADMQRQFRPTATRKPRSLPYRQPQPMCMKPHVKHPNPTPWPFHSPRLGYLAGLEAERCSTLNARKRREVVTDGDPYREEHLYWSHRILYNATDSVYDCPSHNTLTILIAVLLTILIPSVGISLLQCIRLFYGHGFAKYSA